MCTGMLKPQKECDMRCKRPQDFIASCWFVALLGFFVLKILQQIASCHLRTKLQNRFCPLSQVGRILKHTLAFFYSCFLLQFRWDVSALSGDTRPLRYCVSGVVSPDCCFLEEPIPREETIGSLLVFFWLFPMDEAWGFDLGLRDRQGNNTTLWKPAGCQEMARSPKDVHPKKKGDSGDWKFEVGSSGSLLIRQVWP